MLLDGIYDHGELVNPITLRRFDNNQIWGLYKGTKWTLTAMKWNTKGTDCTYFVWEDYYSSTLTTSLFCHNPTGGLFLNGNGATPYTTATGAAFWDRCSCYDQTGWHN